MYDLYTALYLGNLARLCTLDPYEWGRFLFLRINNSTKLCLTRSKRTNIVHLLIQVCCPELLSFVFVFQLKFCSVLRRLCVAFCMCASLLQNRINFSMYCMLNMNMYLYVENAAHKEQIDCEIYAKRKKNDSQLFKKKSLKRNKNKCSGECKKFTRAI